MKLIRFGERGKERPGVYHNNIRYDVSGFGEDYTEAFFSTDGLSRLAAWWKDNIEACDAVLHTERVAPPICRPSKIICIGLNYSDHAAETGAAMPTEPVVFFKSTTAIIGAFDDLMLPRNHEKTDWEVELAVIIGKQALYVEEAVAMDYVAGYMLHNDYSERSFQLERGGQWVKGKSCDTFAPIGPYLVTKEEVPDVQSLRLWLTVNGKLMQDGNTANMIFTVSYLVHYLSQFMTLLPGDVISTGTPAGVGLGQKPVPVYLKEGDVVELGIDGLGSSRQTVKAASSVSK